MARSVLVEKQFDLVKDGCDVAGCRPVNEEDLAADLVERRSKNDASSSIGDPEPVVKVAGVCRPDLQVRYRGRECHGHLVLHGRAADLLVSDEEERCPPLSIGPMILVTDAGLQKRPGAHTTVPSPTVSWM
jgi:hypothetical protein